MCSQKTIHLCKHSSYRKIACSAKQAQRSSCFFFMTPPHCNNTILSQPSIQPCSSCVRKDREIWVSQTAVRKGKEEKAVMHRVGMQEINLTMLQKPQPTHLRLESKLLDTDLVKLSQSVDMPRGMRNSSIDPSIPPGVDLSSVAGGAFHIAHDTPVQQPSCLLPKIILSEQSKPVGSSMDSSSRRQRSPPPLRCPSMSQYVDTTRYPYGDRRVSGVPSGFANTQSVSPQTSTGSLRAEATRRVVDGLGNMI